MPGYSSGEFDGPQLESLSVSNDENEAAPKRPLHKIADDDETSNPWPESRDWPRNLRWLYRLGESWSYSYMGPILRKGRRQFKDGEHLTHDDLFEVPEDLRSSDLVTKFRYVLALKGEALFLHRLTLVYRRRLFQGLLQ